MWIIPLTLLVVFEIVADIFSKEWSLHTDREMLWFLAIASFIVANVFWLSALKHGAGLARGAAIFTIASTIVAALLGLYWYREGITHVQTIGIVLGVGALVLILWE